MHFNQRLSIIAFFLLCFSLTLQAIPAYPGLHKATLPDGTEVMCRLMGDEHGHWYVSTDGRFLDRNDDGRWRVLTEAEVSALQLQRLESQARRENLARRAPQQTTSDDTGRITEFPTQGEVRGLFLLVDFEDVKFQAEHDSVRYQRQLNEEGYADDEATGSARDYFIDQSYGLFTPRFDVVGPIHLPRHESFYGANRMNQDKNPGQMVIDACNLAHDSIGVDFSNYDFDDDGFVDFVFILYAGYGENYGAPANTIWPHMSKLNDMQKHLTLDDKQVNLYACSCELHGKSGNQLDGIGAFCHEFGHVLGLPDFYDVNSQRAQVGTWDVMDTGSYNNSSRTPPSYTAFERYSLGWLDLTELTEPADSITLPEINESRTAYRISTRTGNPGEYFVLENHQQQGWDAYHAGRGMMIFHIDFNATRWKYNAVNSIDPPGYDLVEADGTQGAHAETDLYPTATNDLFTDYSTPSSLAWDKTPTERGVDRIRQEDDGTVSFRFMRDRLARPVVMEPELLTDTSFVALWQPVEEAIGYRIDVQEVLPDSLNPVLLDEDFSEERAYPDGWSGTSCYQMDGRIRIGAYGQSGTLKTSPIDILRYKPLAGSPSPEGDQDEPQAPAGLTLLYTASSYPGKTVSYTLSLIDAEKGEAICDTTMKADRNVVTHLFHFDEVPGQVAFSFKTNKERLFLDELSVAAGLRDSLEMRLLGPAVWSIDSIAPLLTDEGVQADQQQATITGLVPQRTYHFQVIALDKEALRCSLPSEDATVTTLPADQSGIEQLHADPISSKPNNLKTSRPHDLMGRRIIQPSSGFYISDGCVHIIRR